MNIEWKRDALHPGYALPSAGAVFQHLHAEAYTRTTPENVEDVMDAVRRIVETSQPEGATGTTGASVKTWQERMNEDGLYAAGERLYAGWTAVTMARDAEIADLRAQLAAKGQGDEPLCPACQGSGEGLMMEGAGPDTYEVPCNCPYCGGSGGLLDAYHGLVKLLAAEREKYLQACGKLFHASLAAPASAQPDRGAAPMYQAQFDGEYGSSVWRDVTEAAYHTFVPKHRRIVYAAPVAAVAPSDATGKADALAGRIVSVDVSTGDDDYGNRIFAELTGETGSDGTTLLAIETERNFPATVADKTIAAGQEAANAKDAAHVRDKVRDAVAEALDGLYTCGRVWSAWSYGTMSQDDFAPAGEDDDVVDNITDAAIAAMAAAPSSEADK